MAKKISKIKVEYGNNKIKYFDNEEDAKNFAYQKSFYYTVKINNNIFNRIF